ncbi:MAG: hypothetical protein JXA46_15955 [Dehalococcoidales bacterium]|nr:hypothetical protein [Dehalococcoidales bacterium]
MEEKIVYFEEHGPQHTEETLKLAIERARARGINKMVLASTRGETARVAARMLAGTGMKMIIVPHQFGFIHTEQKFTPELVREMNHEGHTVHFGTMLFHTEKLYGNSTSTALANMLRTFCQGMKVCVEIVLMAADAGHVAIGEQIVVVAGTGRGADTAVLALGSTSTHLGDLHITEIICKPLQTRQGPPPPPPEVKV